MFALQMTLAWLAFMAAVLVAIISIVEDESPHVQARKFLVAAILLGIAAYLIK